MLLDSIEIKNYRSLEHIRLDNLQHFNVLIGRNNAGKSSVFLALQQLGQLLLQQGYMLVDVLTDRDQSRAVEIQLTFKPSSQEREAFIDLLIAQGLDSSHKEAMLQSPLFRMVQFSFRSVTGRPDLMHLRETKLFVQGNRWAIIHQMVGDEQLGNPDHKFINLSQASKEVPLQARSLDIDSSSHQYN